ncbi:TadE/TadG family type IV pilus assembly protein [Frankia sp. CiP3]|uniref:TadE/TadG family type IV pilus assembly protein n=1 Tax=Frankia sp. CiP3 TaxID=2880971 RepID=UPI001EF6B2F1|nr:TadE/TadG family type IV pilus assembly protein [Frankia sp. CiP3]
MIFCGGGRATRWGHTHRPGSGGDGSAAVELTLLAPVAILLLLLIVAVGRQIQTRMQVDDAAQAAARAATTARNPAQAQTAARAVVAAGLPGGTPSCRTVIVTVDTSDFRPGGSVRATVACTVDLADLTGLRLPAVRTVESTFTAVIDLYRGVSPGFMNSEAPAGGNPSDGVR